jgi:hypothetical protein
MRRLSSSSWLLCFLLCACDCNGASKTQRAEQPARAAAPAAPAAPKSTVAAERLRAFFPDTIAGFTAPEPAKPQTMPLNHGVGTWTITRRTYEQGPKTLIVEVSDVLHAGAMSQLVQSQQGAKRSNENQTFRGEPVAGFPALIQWNKREKMAGAAVLVAGRVLVTVKVDPTENDEPAVAIASSLPLDQFAKLVIAAAAEERGEPVPATDDVPVKATPAAAEPATEKTAEHAEQPAQPAAKPEAVKP